MAVVLNFALGQEFSKYHASHIISIEIEAVHFGVPVKGEVKIRSLLLRKHHTIASSLRVSDSKAKDFGKQLVAIRQIESGKIIYVVLRQRGSPCHGLSAEFDRLTCLGMNFDLLRLVAAGPYYQISIVNILLLLNVRWCLDELNSFFDAFLNVSIQFLCVASQASVAIDKGGILGIYRRVKIEIVVLFGAQNAIIEDSDAVSIKNFDVTCFKLWQIVIIEIKWLIFEIGR
jgi:hypothetical protein